MRECLNKILIVAITLVVLWLPATIQAQETLLRWKNGDSLSGKLLDSKSGKIRWKSPYFSDDLIVDINVLDSVVFSKQFSSTTETFRVGTVSGDVWTADIVDSDENTFLFSSKRYGTFRVNRTAIYSLENREHSNLVFDGSQLASWLISNKDQTKERVQISNNIQKTGWYADRGGHPRTDQGKANIYHALEWPQRFEIDIELASTTRPPGFVFALGKNLYEALRLETWVNELVVVQGTLFEPIMKIEPDRRNFRLRLAYDQDTLVLKVFDVNGNMLLKLDGVNPTHNVSGPYIYNRGQDLTVRRLRVYRQPAEHKDQQVDFSKPRVHMMDGEVLHGKLFVEDGKGFVIGTVGERVDIDLKQIDRVVQPGRTLITTEPYMMALTYLDGSIINGHTLQLNPDSVVIQTSFADKPIECSLEGVSWLQLESKSKTNKRITGYDKMFFSTGSLRGHVIFDTNDESSVLWKPIGMSQPVRLANNQAARIERNNKYLSRLRPFSVKTFPHLLHLKDGEVIPCQVLSYDKTSINFRSPFIGATRMDSAYIKGIEFSRGKTQTRKENRNPITITGGNKHRIILEDGRILEAMARRSKDGTLQIVVDTGKLGVDPKTVVLVGDFANNDAVALKRAVELLFDPLETQSEKLDEKVQRALTVPRFIRDNPPNHILVANNGDLMRGKLISFNGKVIQFESKLKKIPIPIERVVRVIDVSVDTPEESAEGAVGNQESAIGESEIRFALLHNPILIFEPLEVKADKLFGRSPIYGEVSIPVNSIQYIHFGEKAKSFKSIFAEWVVKPAKEPDYGTDR
jgi:hypothetical protein